MYEKSHQCTQPSASWDTKQPQKNREEKNIHQDEKTFTTYKAAEKPDARSMCPTYNLFYQRIHLHAQVRNIYTNTNRGYHQMVRI